MKLRLLPATMAVLVSLALPAAASATPPTVTVAPGSTTATFSDSGTNADQVKVTIGPGDIPGATTKYTFTDNVSMSSGNPLACTPASGTTIACNVPGGTGVDVNLGDAPSHAPQVVVFGSGDWTGQTSTAEGGSGNDSFQGAAGKETFTGGAGDDVLDGGLGADKLDGGTGTNTADYSKDSRTAGVTVDIGAGTGPDGDTFVSAGSPATSTIQNVVGTSLADTLKGDAQANAFTGGLGQDTVDAGAGDDTLDLVDSQVDTATCGDGSDTVNADSVDNVAGDCEHVTAPPPPSSSSPAPPTPPAPSALSIDDRSLTEGNTGTRTMTFTVSLSAPQPAAVTVPYASADITAKAKSDYGPVSGSLTFAPGETKKTIAVAIIGDRRVEPNETFAVAMGRPSGNATLPARFYGTGTIVNDDKKAPKGKPRPAAFTAKAAPKADHSAPFSFRVSGRLGVPSGVSARRACTGSVAVVVQAGKKKVRGRVPVSKACVYGFQFHTAARLGRFTFRVRFLGNKVLAPSATRTLHVRAG